MLKISAEYIFQALPNMIRNFVNNLNLVELYKLKDFKVKLFIYSFYIYTSILDDINYLQVIFDLHHIK